MGGGVILDLSHELDYCEYLFGEITKISGQAEKRSQITVDTEDCADFLLMTKTTPVNLHLNYCSHFRTRTIQIDFAQFSLLADLNNQTIQKYQQEKLITALNFPVERNYSYEQEIKYFFANLGKQKLTADWQKTVLLFKKIVEFKKKYV